MNDFWLFLSCMGFAFWIYTKGYKVGKESSKE